MKKKQGLCEICTKFCTALNWHHTIPQALGGRDSLQIPLCPTCHDTLHAHGESIAAKIRNGKKIERVYWKTPLEEERAKPYLEILVNALINPPVTPEEKTTKLVIGLHGNIHKGLHQLKVDLAHKGISTMEQAALYCISTVLHKRGLLNNGNNSPEKSKPENSKINKTFLW